MQYECENCTDTSEKKEVKTEMQKIVNESQLHATTAEADDLMVILTAKLDESKKIREKERSEIRLEYPEPKAVSRCSNQKRTRNSSKLDAIPGFAREFYYLWLFTLMRIIRIQICTSISSNHR
ncbi:hypothetical protein Y032_0001g366 [Ancylostoma ceylanicum]|uniref:Uncharacterized protein n=1 Tax=Ancylostoma ceylanicum TaxID=53326 RepID=A0A016W4V8_9BILA|nr:hypothetical protein Y032_0001g366 [Ancylostoma ceylanicum]